MQLAARLGNAVGVNLPAQIVDEHVRRHTVAQTRNGGAGVVVDSVEVAPSAAADRGVGLEGEHLLAQTHSAAHRTLKGQLVKACQQAVQGVAPVQRAEDAQVVGKADAGILVAHLAPHAVQHLVALDVAGGHMGQHRAVRPQGVLVGRPATAEIAVEGVDIGLVDGDVLAYQVAHRAHHLFGKAQVEVHAAGVFESAHSLKPAGIGEMVQRQQRADTCIHHRLDFGAVVLQGSLVKLTLLRLDAAPLHTEAAMADAHRDHQVQVLLPAVIVVVGVEGGAAVLDVTCAAPVVPAVVAVTALYLGGGGGDAQLKVVGETKCVHFSAPFACFFVSLIINRQASRRQCKELFDKKM